LVSFCIYKNVANSDVRTDVIISGKNPTGNSFCRCNDDRAWNSADRLHVAVQSQSTGWLCTSKYRRRQLQIDDSRLDFVSAYISCTTLRC